VRGVVAQRLVRKICPKCSQPHPPSPAELEALGLPADVECGRFRQGAGCAACHGTGFHGRLGIFEIFVINEELQQLIHERASGRQLRERARALGMRTLREDGARKVSAGLTTAGEVVSITAGDARHFNPPDPI
jgi:general secretion pathway protein E/type IV pilus assembly protein PilB